MIFIFPVNLELHEELMRGARVLADAPWVTIADDNDLDQLPFYRKYEMSKGGKTHERISGTTNAQTIRAYEQRRHFSFYFGHSNASRFARDSI